jgi:hypothetical protein
MFEYHYNPGRKAFTDSLFMPLLLCGSLFMFIELLSLVLGDIVMAIFARLVFTCCIFSTYKIKIAINNSRLARRRPMLRDKFNYLIPGLCSFNILVLVFFVPRFDPPLVLYICALGHSTIALMEECLAIDWLHEQERRIRDTRRSSTTNKDDNSPLVSHHGSVVLHIGYPDTEPDLLRPRNSLYTWVAHKILDMYRIPPN